MVLDRPLDHGPTDEAGDHSDEPIAILDHSTDSEAHRTGRLSRVSRYSAFSGLVHLDDDDYEAACKLDDAHSICCIISNRMM